MLRLACQRLGQRVALDEALARIRSRWRHRAVVRTVPDRFASECDRDNVFAAQNRFEPDGVAPIAMRDDAAE